MVQFPAPKSVPVLLFQHGTITCIRTKSIHIIKFLSRHTPQTILMTSWSHYMTSNMNPSDSKPYRSRFFFIYIWWWQCYKTCHNKCLAAIQKLPHQPGDKRWPKSGRIKQGSYTSGRDLQSSLSCTVQFWK